MGKKQPGIYRKELSKEERLLSKIFSEKEWLIRINNNLYLEMK